MISFKQHLLEKRKNPEQNPKISAYDALEPYKNDPNIYISFTDIDKIGINPHSNFNTPNGIYTYPLKEIWKEFDHKKRWVDVPFAGKAPFVWILQEKCKKLQIISKYNSSDYDNDMRKIRKLYDDKKILTKMKKTVDAGFNQNWRSIKIEAGHYYKIFNPTNEPTPINIGKFDDHFKWDDDKLTKIIKSFEDNPDKSLLNDIVGEIPLEPSTIDRLLLSPEKGGIGSSLLKKRVLKMEIENHFNGLLKTLAESGLSPIDILINNATDSTKIKSPFGAFWNVTRWIAYEGNPSGSGIASGMDMGKYKQIKLPIFTDVSNNPFEDKPKKLTKANKYLHTDTTISVNLTSQKWNNLLRKLDYCGFADKQGTGSIHPSEPMQSVFLAKNGFKVIDKIRNINPKKGK